MYIPQGRCMVFFKAFLGFIPVRPNFIYKHWKQPEQEQIAVQLNMLQSKNQKH